MAERKFDWFQKSSENDQNSWTWLDKVRFVPHVKNSTII